MTGRGKNNSKRQKQQEVAKRAETSKYGVIKKTRQEQAKTTGRRKNNMKGKT